MSIRRVKRSAAGLLVLAVAMVSAACGGGGGGGGAVVGSGSGSGSGGGSGGGSGSGSGWVAGVFPPAVSFKDLCAMPRSGTDPDTGQPWPDQAGQTLDENNWLRSWSNDTYLWYDEIEDRDPGSSSNPVSYFGLLKTFATTPSGSLKDQFHFTYDTDAWIALSQSGVSVDYGVTWAILEALPPREVAVAYSQPSSPAGNEGITRGARVLSIDGIDVVDDNSPAGVDAINAALFPEAAGEVHVFEIEDLGASGSRFVQLTAEAVTSTPVQHTQVVDSPGGASVGYLLFNDHIATAEQGLVDAIDALASEPGGIDDLVIDIRYNGGGYLVIASQLAYMVAGSAQTAGRIFEQTQFNDKHPTINPVTGNAISPLPFVSETIGLGTPTAGEPLPTLDLPRVFVLTGGSTCSASEAIINGLRGAGVEVIQIGATTCGKPYGFYPTDNCGTTYFTIQFRGVNNMNFGDYPDGFTPSGSSTGANDTSPPGCPAIDDLDHGFGDPNEARLATALYYRDNLSCPSVPFGSSGVSATGSSKPVGVTSEPRIVKPLPLTNRLLGF